MFDGLCLMACVCSIFHVMEGKDRQGLILTNVITVMELKHIEA